MVVIPRHQVVQFLVGIFLLFPLIGNAEKAASKQAKINKVKTPIQIGQTSSTITSAGGCDFWRIGSGQPKLVKKLVEGSKKDWHVDYEHNSGRPILLEAMVENDSKIAAALNINGKELLLYQASAEIQIKCFDEILKKKVPCRSRYYSNQTIKVKVKQLTQQSACSPNRGECASYSVSALITVENATSKVSFLGVGACGG